MITLIYNGMLGWKNNATEDDNQTKYQRFLQKIFKKNWKWVSLLGMTFSIIKKLKYSGGPTTPWREDKVALEIGIQEKAHSTVFGIHSPPVLCSWPKAMHKLFPLENIQVHRSTHLQ
jgi:hypothetical protein